MKKIIFFIIIMNFIINTYGQSLSTPKMGLGLQAGYPASFGLSAKMDFTDTHSAQATVGIFGPISSFLGKYMYCFSENGNNFVIKPYLFAQAGFLKYKINFINNNEDNIIFLGYGAGGGIEWYLPFLSDNLRVSWELGYGKFSSLNTLLANYGIHYYFEF